MNCLRLNMSALQCALSLIKGASANFRYLIHSASLWSALLTCIGSDVWVLGGSLGVTGGYWGIFGSDFVPLEANYYQWSSQSPQNPNIAAYAYMSLDGTIAVFHTFAYSRGLYIISNTNYSKPVSLEMTPVGKLLPLMRRCIKSLLGEIYSHQSLENLKLFS